MSDFSVLVNKIIQDAENKKQDIVEKAKQESEKIVSKKIKEANEYKDSIVKKAHLDGKEIKEKIISKCELKIRNSKLAAKRKVMDEVFSKSLDNLVNLDEDQFKKYVIYHIFDSNLSGEYTLVIPTKYVGVLDELKLSIENENRKEIKILEIKPSDILKGGFILENNGVFINYSFEVLVSSIRDEIEFEVSNLLFN